MILHPQDIAKIKQLCIEGLQTDGAHHKQKYLEQILKCLYEDIESLNPNESVWEHGIPS